MDRPQAGGYNVYEIALGLCRGCGGVTIESVTCNRVTLSSPISSRLIFARPMTSRPIAMNPIATALSATAPTAIAPIAHPLPERELQSARTCSALPQFRLISSR
jgi:hypothetical protein